MHTGSVIARLAAALITGAAATSAHADVVLFTLEDKDGNPDRTAGDRSALVLAHNNFGALIKRTSGERFTVWDSGGVDVPESWGRKHLSPAFNYFLDDYFVMSFTAPVWRISIEFGDYGQDEDIAEIHAYKGLDGQGQLLGSAYGYLGLSDISQDPPTRVTYTAPYDKGFSSVLFRGGITPFYQSTFIDNIVVHIGHAPAPGPTAVFAIAAAALAARRRR